MSSAKDSSSFVVHKVENLDVEADMSEIIDDKESVLRPYLGLLELNSAIYSKPCDKGGGPQEASPSKNLRNSSGTEQVFRCPFCPFAAVRSSSMQSHLTHHQKPPAAYRCRLCTFSSDMPISVTFHQQRVHKVPSGATPSPAATFRRRSVRQPLSKIIFCPTDSGGASTSRAPSSGGERELTSQSGPSTHVTQLKSVLKRCPECPFRSGRRLKIHMLHHCKPPRAFVCPYCTYSADNNQSIIGHAKLHKGPADGTTVTARSAATSVSVNNAASRNKIVGKAKPHTVANVSTVAASANTKTINDSLNSVHPSSQRRMHKCPAPGCPFYGQKFLIHYRHHQVQMKYKCNQCSFTSNFINGISTHKRKHAKYDAVAASTEQQISSSSGSVKASGNTNVTSLSSLLSKKRNKYKCSECLFSTSVRARLVNHQHHHFLNPPASFRCCDCTYSTDAYLSLIAHSRIHKLAIGGINTESGLVAALWRRQQRKANQRRTRNAVRKAALRARDGTFVAAAAATPKQNVMAEVQKQVVVDRESMEHLATGGDISFVDSVALRKRKRPTHYDSTTDQPLGLQSKSECFSEPKHFPVRNNHLAIATAAESLPQTKNCVLRSQPTADRTADEGPTATTVARRTTLNSTFSAGLRHLPPSIAMYMGSSEGDDIILKRRHSDGQSAADVVVFKEDAKSADSFVRKFVKKATGSLARKNTKGPAVGGNGVAGFLRNCLRDVSSAHFDDVSVMSTNTTSGGCSNQRSDEKLLRKSPKSRSDTQREETKTQASLSTITYTITTATAIPSSTTTKQSVATTTTTTTSSTTLNTTVNFLPRDRPPPVYILPRLRGVKVWVEQLSMDVLLREHCAAHRIVLPTAESVCEALAADYAVHGLMFSRSFFEERVKNASIKALPTTARPRRSVTNQRARFSATKKMLTYSAATHYCVNCHREFQKKSSYVFHVLNQHGIFIGENSLVCKYFADLTTKEIEKTIFRCEFCLSDWKTIEEWVAHRVEAHDRTYRPVSVVDVIHRIRRRRHLNLCSQASSNAQAFDEENTNNGYTNEDDEQEEDDDYDYDKEEVEEEEVKEEEEENGGSLVKAKSNDNYTRDEPICSSSTGSRFSTKRLMSANVTFDDTRPSPKKQRQLASLPPSLLAARGFPLSLNLRRPQLAWRGCALPQTARRGRNGWRSGVRGISVAQLKNIRNEACGSTNYIGRQVDNNDEPNSESMENLKESNNNDEEESIIVDGPTDRSPVAPTSPPNANHCASPTLTAHKEGDNGVERSVANNTNISPRRSANVEVIVISSDDEESEVDGSSGVAGSMCNTNIDEKPALLNGRLVSLLLLKNPLSGSFITKSSLLSGGENHHRTGIIKSPLVAPNDDSVSGEKATSPSASALMSDGQIRGITSSSCSEQKQQPSAQQFFSSSAVATTSGRRMMNDDDEEMEKNARLAYEIMTNEASLFDRRLPQFFVADERLRAYTRVAGALHANGWRADGGGLLTVADVCRRWRFLIDEFKRERSERSVSPASSVPLGHQHPLAVSAMGGCMEWYEAYCSITSTVGGRRSVIGKDVDQILDEEILRHAASSVKDEDTASNSDLPSIASSVATMATSGPISE